METILWALGIAATLVFGVSANERMEQGLPVIPKLSGFKPDGLLPEGDHIEEIYQPQGVDQFVHPMQAVQTVSDPHVDSYVQEWVDAHESEGTGDQVGGYAPEALEISRNGDRNYQNIPVENLIENPQNDQNSLRVPTDNFDQRFRDNVETPGDRVVETAGYFNIDDDQSENEWLAFFDEVTVDGVSPKGKDIIWALWGVKPGNSNRYREAVRRRNEYALRIENGEIAEA